LVGPWLRGPSLHLAAPSGGIVVLVAARSLGGLVFSNGRYALNAATSAAAATSFAYS